MTARDPTPPVALPAGSRPLLSVMIPTYRPGPYLKETLAGILAQDLGAPAMQIVIVDDASPETDVAALVRQLAPPGRIEVHRNAVNLGLAGNWNRCLKLARGEFVHLLHQDDLVLPGFYAALMAGLQWSGTGMAFCRHDFIDAAGRPTRRSHRERWSAGILSDWLLRISQKQRIQCPAALVRRSVYEMLGGFRTDLPYALDWEMWVRIAARFPVWYEPRMLACYRRHDSSETHRLMATGKTDADALAAIEVFAEHIPVSARERLKAKAYRRAIRTHLRRAVKLLDAGLKPVAAGQVDIARVAMNHVPEGPGMWWQRYRLKRIAGRIAHGSR